MINPTKVRDALAQRQEPECDHPTDQIMDRPDKSYCRKCGQDVAPLRPGGFHDTNPPGRATEEWMRRSVFPVFPSGE